MSRLPDGVVVLHIGPYKTGTTTVQAAFHQNRSALEAQGVHYGGPKAHSAAASMAASTGKALPTADPSVGQARWRELVDEVNGSTARATVVSSEYYSDSSPARIREIVSALGGERVHVVVTVRPVVRIFASQWQQYMQNRPGLTYDDRLDYEGWLDEILHRPEAVAITPTFWRRHRHDAVVRTWAEAVGADRMTVIVVDERDKRMLVRSFEEMLGLTEGTLEPRELTANRSLTLPEVQMLRAFNSEWLERGWSFTDYTRFVRFGAVRHLQERTPSPDEPRLLTPAWAVERGAEIGAEIAREIAATGVEVVGDLRLLGDPSVAVGVGNNPTTVEVPADAVARFTAGLLRVVAEIPGAAPPTGRNVGELEAMVRRATRDPARVEASIRAASQELASTMLVDELSAAQLARVVAGRLRRRLRAVRDGRKRPRSS